MDRMISNEVDQWRTGAAGIVEVGDSVTQPGAQVQQGRRGFAGHAPITVGRARAHAFEEPEHGAHARDRIDALHHMHLRGAGIRETRVHSLVEQRADEALRTIDCLRLGHQDTWAQKRVMIATASWAFTQGSSPYIIGIKRLMDLMSLMRTTLTIDDELARKVEAERRRTGRTMQTIVNELLRDGLALRKQPPAPERFRTDPVALQLRGGIDPAKLNQLVDELDADSGINLRDRP